MQGMQGDKHNGVSSFFEKWNKMTEKSATILLVLPKNIRLPPNMFYGGCFSQAKAQPTENLDWQLSATLLGDLQRILT
jgi:hypothetical protein